MEENKLTTIDDLKRIYGDVFIMSEENLMIVEVLVAIALSVHFDGDPIWLMIIGGSSSGKSELIGTLNKVKWNTAISTLTENTFLSGMKPTGGNETSLLLKIGKRGLITFKDYTSLLSMRSEKKEVIVAQMREIFDGSLVKMTGNGASVRWPLSGKGKINFVLAVTPSIYTKEGESAGMGRRALYFVMPSQDEKEMCRRQRANANTIDEKREHIQDVFQEYVERMASQKPDDLPELDPILADELIDLSIFVTQARTPVERDFKGNLRLVHDKELAMRMYGQIEMLARVIQWMNNGVLSPDHHKLIFKMALDGIPRQRMDVIRVMSEYTRVKASGAAVVLNMTTEWAMAQIEELNWLGCVKRTKSASRVDWYVLKEEYRQLVQKYLHITDKKQELMYNEETDSYNGGTTDNELSTLQSMDDDGWDPFPEYNEGFDKGELKEMEANKKEEVEQKLLEKEKIRKEHERQLQDKIQKEREESDAIENSKFKF